jgi:urease subunit alpha
VPDLLGLVREPSIVCSSTTPTLPFGVHTALENVPMTMLNHGLSWDVPGDLRLVLERTLEARTAAEGPLHELGAIQIVNSDSQGMGRIGEVVRRAFQCAEAMRSQLGPEPGRADNERVLRYLAKVTINPAIAHGLAAHVGSLEIGKLADVVMWAPELFAVRPELVLKAGIPAWGASGEGDGSTLSAPSARRPPGYRWPSSRVRRSTSSSRPFGHARPSRVAASSRLRTCCETPAPEASRLTPRAARSGSTASRFARGPWSALPSRGRT